MRIFINHPNNVAHPKAGSIEVSLEECLGIEPSSCEEIVVNNCLDFIPFDQRPNVLKQIISKLRSNGKIVLSGIDLYQLCGKYRLGSLNIQQINQILGSVASTDNMTRMISMLQSGSLEIERSEISDFQYSVIAKRVS